MTSLFDAPGSTALPVKSAREKTLRPDPFGTDTEAARAARSGRWATGPLGPVAQWPDTLSAAVQVVMSAPMPMLLVWGPEMTQIYNDGYRQVIGHKHPVAMGAPASQTWREAWTTVGPLLSSVLRGEGSVSQDDLMLVINRYGYPEETHWSFSYSPWPDDPAGGVAGVLVVAQEVTAGVFQQRRLSTLHELAVAGLTPATAPESCRQAVAALGRDRLDLPLAAVYLADTTGRLQLQAGYGAAKTSFWLPEQMEADSTHPYARAFAEGEDVHVRETEVVGRLQPGPTGPARPTSVSAVPLNVRHGEAAGVIVWATNPYRPLDENFDHFLHLVSEYVTASVGRALTAAEKEWRAEKATLLDAARTRFYENASHELRSPLTILSLAVEVLKPHLDSIGKPHLAAMTRALERLNGLVDALLSFVNADSHAFEPHFEDIDLTEATKAVLAMFPTVAEQAGLSLTTQIDEVGDVEVDPEAWNRIVTNLVSNAVKYTAQGGVTVKLTRGNGDVHLEVSDTGVGIDDADQAMIFRRFRRGEAGLVRDVRGLGLGLALVDDLVRAHEGTIEVHSRLGDGATFAVDLPRRRTERHGSTVAQDERRSGDVKSIGDGQGYARLPGIEAGPPSLAHAAPAAAPTDPAGPRRGRLLLVEDDEELRDHLCALLTHDGWQVTGARNVPAAVALADPPDLVLSDIMLPGPSGLDLVRLLRNQPGWDSLPIVLLTGRTGTGDIVKGLESGADDYIVKPFHPDELLARLAVHSEMARRRGTARHEAEVRADNLQVALGTNRRIGLALGILMSQYRLTDEQAFEMLRKASNNRNERLRDLAEEVIMTGWLDAAPVQPVD